MIELWFERFLDQELEKKIPGRIYLIRLFCRIRFKTHDGWTDPYPAVLDTGAPVSLIPFNIWSKSVVNPLTDHRVRGVVPKEECSLRVLVGELNCLLADERNYSSELTTVSYLTFTNDVPLIIGFKDLLENFEVCFNYKENKAWIEEG